VRFVDNIRRYQNVLYWLHAGEEFQENKHRTWMEGVALVPVSVHVM
jgi:hypothetical protein